MTSTWSSAHAKAHGGGEEEEGGGGEGGHGGDAPAGAHGAHHETGEVDAQSTVIIVAFLIAMTLGFEFAKDMAEEAVPREMRPVLGQIFSEFTVLGFMAMVTYFMIQANVLAAASSLVYHDPEHLVHLFEKVHFDLFFVMMAFAAIAVWLLLATFAARRKWLSFERFAVLHSKHVQVPAERRLPLGARVVHKKHGVGTIIRSCTTAALRPLRQRRRAPLQRAQLVEARQRAARGRGGGGAGAGARGGVAARRRQDLRVGRPAGIASAAPPSSERQAEAPPGPGTASGKTSGNASGTASVDGTAMPEEYLAPAAAARRRPSRAREPAGYHAAAATRRAEGGAAASNDARPPRPPRPTPLVLRRSLHPSASTLSSLTSPSTPCRLLHTPLAPSPTLRPVSQVIGTISQSSSRVSVDTPQDEWKVASTTMAAARHVAAAEVCTSRDWPRRPLRGGAPRMASRRTSSRGCGCARRGSSCSTRWSASGSC